MATIDRRTAAAALLLAPLLARAHGDAHPKTGPVKREQQDWGIAGERKDARRTVMLRMLDTMRFVPDRVEVRRGQTVRFVVVNEGRLKHEFVIGTEAALAAHATLMEKFPDMEHDEPWMAHVDPGKRAEVVWTFNRPGRFAYACLIAGHYTAGMTGTLIVKEI